jgi:hypothetical protein
MDPPPGKVIAVEKKEFQPPIEIDRSDGKIQISYDHVWVEIPQGGPVPEGTPALAQRIFEAFTYDLGADLRAE